MNACEADPTDPLPARLVLALNGEPTEVPEGATIAALVERMGLAGKRIAVERNGAIVPRSSHASERLAAGDRIEIVAAVGGG